MIERFAQMPSALRDRARWQRLGSHGVPTLLAHPDWDAGEQAPVVIWMHGRTVHKELDPGRYLRWIRAGIGVCAVDLPGHGKRFEAALQQPQATLEVVKQMADEIDSLIEALVELGVFDVGHLGIGGMSAGAMAVLVRLCSPHPFACASVEATTGSWSHQRHRAMFNDHNWIEASALDPIDHLDQWREIPFQAIHARFDEYVASQGQAEFVNALRERYADPGLIEFIQYDRTGAPYEHAGFGNMAADAKNRQAAFFARQLVGA
ncbi:MAG: prolyl oligopeptidase family serine peptidase [Phycisphaerales bacterium]